MKKLLAAILVLLYPPLRAHAKLSDVQVVALTILGEARGEGSVGMQAVANVIQNRAILHGQTCREICLAPKQFSFWNNGMTQATFQKLIACPQAPYAMELAEKLVKGMRVHDITGRATHYHATSCNPKWAIGRFRTCDIGSHRFYRLI